MLSTPHLEIRAFIQNSERARRRGREKKLIFCTPMEFSQQCGDSSPIDSWQQRLWIQWHFTREIKS